MSTETEISHNHPYANTNWGPVRAALGILVVAQVLLLWIYLEYAPGYFIASVALGGAAFQFLITLSRSRKSAAMAVMPFAENADHIGDDLFDDLPVPMIDSD